MFDLKYKDTNGKEHLIPNFPFSNTKNNIEKEYIKYYETGDSVYKVYLKQGLFHKEYGPAILLYDKFGKVQFKLYYIEGKQIVK